MIITTTTINMIMIAMTIMAGVSGLMPCGQCRLLHV